MLFCLCHRLQTDPTVNTEQSVCAQSPQLFRISCSKSGKPPDCVLMIRPDGGKQFLFTDVLGFFCCVTDKDLCLQERLNWQRSKKTQTGLTLSNTVPPMKVFIPWWSNMLMTIHFTSKHQILLLLLLFCYYLFYSQWKIYTYYNNSNVQIIMHTTTTNSNLTYKSI